MATLLLRSTRSSKVPQAVSSLAMPPEPPAEHAAAKDRHMHGSAGRHQVATLPSSSSIEAPFAAPSAAMLSAHGEQLNMILSQPGASSAQPSGLLLGPWNFGSPGRRITPLVLGEARESWRCPTGGAEHTRSSLLMV